MASLVGSTRAGAWSGTQGAALVLGIDIGTTATKAILLHPEMGIVAEAEAPSTLRSPQAGWAEEDPEEWWANVAVVTRACLAVGRVQPQQVRAVGVSGMVPTLVLLDSRGATLYPSIQQNDARADNEIAELRGCVAAEDVLKRTGSAITQQSVGPKLLWLRRHHPGIMERATHLMGSYDYVVCRLTACFSSERNWALESGLFDLQGEVWDAEMLRLCTLPPEWLGEVHWPSQVIGELTSDAAAHTGLVTGTPVVAGSADHIASAFSAGVKAPADLLVKLGGAGDILYSLDQLIVDERLFLDYHVIPGKYLLNGCMAASGSILKWFRREFAADIDYAALDREAAGVPPGAEKLVLLPYFLGEKSPLNDPLARGVLLGLTLGHTRAHVFRAALEGISYGFRHHLEVLAERGLTATRARVTNGGARSKLWKQVTADVLGIPLEEIAEHPGSSLGAAFVAGMGAGVFQDWAEIERFVRISDVVEPDMYGPCTLSTILRGVPAGLRAAERAVCGAAQDLGTGSGTTRTGSALQWRTTQWRALRATLAVPSRPPTVGRRSTLEQQDRLADGGGGPQSGGLQIRLWVAGEPGAPVRRAV